MERPDVVSRSPYGTIRFADHEGTPAVDVAGGQAFMWASRTEARTFFQSCLAVLDHEEARR